MTGMATEGPTIGVTARAATAGCAPLPPFNPQPAVFRCTECSVTRDPQC
jgi:hypothetical protein